MNFYENLNEKKILFRNNTFDYLEKLKLLLHFPITDSIKTTKKKTVSGFAYNSQMIKFRHIQVYVIRNRIYHYFAIKINFFD